jgi:ubiquinone/menaquinone biosynthesis C-methylase UbiE
VVHDRDVAAFSERAPGYESGWRGRLHHDIADRATDLALAGSSGSSGSGRPHRVLDVGCGTGYLLRRLATQVPEAGELAGIDAATAMIETARTMTSDRRIQFAMATAEQLPYPQETFDLVISTTSFDHWADQRAGLAECFRVLVPGGRLVLIDLFSAWLVPTLLAGRRDKARTKRRATRLLAEAGFPAPQWHDLYAVIIRAAIAARPADKVDLPPH